MYAILNISQARANLAQLVKRVYTTKEPVILLQDSKPVVVITPYSPSLIAVPANEKYETKPLAALAGYLKDAPRHNYKTERDAVTEAVVEKFLKKETSSK